MTTRFPLPEEIQETLTQGFNAADPEAKVLARRTSLGWLHLRVVTSDFQNLPLVARENKVDELLATLDFGLGQFPLANHELLTPEEAAQVTAQPLQLPLWSEVLMAPEPLLPTNSGTDDFLRPSVVTFYSFKGGVGRSTALAIVAGILAHRGRRVVVVDFDLEAPGLSALFSINETTSNGGQLGVLDYLHQRYLTPDKQQPSIEYCVRQVDLKSRGELYLVPAGEYDEGYVHRLADLSIRSLYQREVNPVRQLIGDIKDAIDPDLILIDARTGFDDVGAVALLDLADTGVICFSPTDQNLQGLKWIVRAASRQREYKTFPDLRFLLTPIPPVTEEQKRIFVSKAEDWIEENWELGSEMPVQDLYHTVLYNPNVAILSSPVNDVPKSVLDSYESIADALDASLPDPRELMSRAFEDREVVLDELQFEAATAWELNLENTAAIFQRTDDFPRFLDDRVWLIRGAKGTGKSLLFRLFVEQGPEARRLAEPNAKLDKTMFVPGHGPTSLSKQRPILNSSDLDSYERQAGENSWPSFWLNYLLLQAYNGLPGLASNNLTQDNQLLNLSKTEQPEHKAIVAWLVERAQSPESGPQAMDELRAVDQWLEQNNKKMWLFYDELDASFGSESQGRTRRRRALEALFAWWLEVGPSLDAIVPKLLLRNDIWNDLNFTNKGHYARRDLELRWEEVDLWRLVLRQALVSSKTLRSYLEQELGTTLNRLDSSDEGQLRRSLRPLWGERMGSTKKAYTHNWVRTRITDTQGNRFPRSLILLLHEAVEIEKNFTSAGVPGTVLRPRALIDSLPFVSSQRVQEVSDEYPELGGYLKNLQNQRSPIDDSQLASVWGKQGAELDELIKDMVEAGVLEGRSRSSESGERRYTVAELYLYGLEMVRKGQR